MIPNMSDQLDNDLRLRQKSEPLESEDQLFSPSGMNGVHSSLLTTNPLFHGVDSGVLQRLATEKRDEALMENVREAAEQAKETFVKHMEDHLCSKNTNSATNSERMELKDDNANERKRSLKRNAENMFVPRESLLTELLQNPNIQTVSNIFVAVLVVIFVKSVFFQYLRVGRISVTFELAFWCLGKIPLVLYIWCQMMMWVSAVFYATFTFWAHHPNPDCGPWKISNKVWSLLYVLGILVFFLYPPAAIISNDLPILSSMVILIEQSRLMMKMHAFTRVVVPRAFAWKQRRRTGAKKVDDNSEMVQSTGFKGMEPCPDFSLFLYFLFAPTLIYQDKYPRTSKIRWDVVRNNFVQCLVCGSYVFLIVVHFAVPVTEKFAQEPYNIRDFLRVTFTCMIPACVCLFLSFHCVLHSWLNAWAEMMCFADRLFYKDWWNSASFSEYYRNWNLVVHKWLYAYFYKDLRALGCGPTVSLVSVFLLSATFHEYIVAVSLRFCFPVLFILFGIFGVTFMFLPNLGSTNLRGTLLWLVLIIGSGILVCLYSFEWYSRKNCPGDYKWYWDIFIPRSLFCNRMHLV